MHALRLVLTVKLALTVVLWSAPLLLAPAAWLAALGFPEPRPLLFVRLLGVAYAALAVGYALGLRDVRRGRRPEMVAWVGLVSNGGAAAVLALAAAGGAWSAWGPLAQTYMWASLVATAAIAVGLTAFGGVRAQAS
ncbi:MAG: hypothetical protein AAFQ43_04275 [Bacteroidota bacterium]